VVGKHFPACPREAAWGVVEHGCVSWQWGVHVRMCAQGQRQEGRWRGVVV